MSAGSDISSSQPFLHGLRDTLPLLVAAAPFGLVYGALAAGEGGLSAAAAQAMSLAVFAGSSQFAAVGLLTQGAGVAIILLTTLVVNLRHGLYGAALSPHTRSLPRWMLALIAFWLTDETFAVTSTHWPYAARREMVRYHFGSAVGMYLNWNLWTAVGVFGGRRLEGLGELGLDFAMVVTFIGIVVPLLTSMPRVLSALVAGLGAVALGGLPNGSGLLVAMLAGIGAGYAAERMGRGASHPRGQGRGSTGEGQA